MRVYKETIPVDDQWHTIRMLRGASGIVHVGSQFGDADTVQIWYRVGETPDAPQMTAVQVKVVGTGHFIEDDQDIAVVGTVIPASTGGRLVWHVVARPGLEFIEELDLTVRAYNVLKREGVHTVEKLLELTAADLYDMRNMGQGGVDSVVGSLARFNLTLR